jgi:transposase
MGYSSDVTDKEWEIIEPLLPQKKKTRPPVWTKRQISSMAYSINSRMVVLKDTLNAISASPKGFLKDTASHIAPLRSTSRFAYNWSDLPRDLPPYSTVFWHYQNWCEDGVIDEIMTQLHSKAREQVQKNRSGRR